MSTTAAQNDLGFDESNAPWLRRVREPARVYAAFKLFRDIGPRRTLLEAYRQWKQAEFAGGLDTDGKDPLAPADTSTLTAAPEIGAGGVPSNWKRWRKDWDWDERAIAWDLQQESEAKRRRDDELARIRDQRAEQRRQLDQVRYEQIVRANQKVMNILDQPQLARKRQEKDAADGSRVIQEVDDIKNFEVLSEQVREMENSYFGELSDVTPANDGKALQVTGEFTWTPDPEIEGVEMPALPGPEEGSSSAPPPLGSRPSSADPSSTALTPVSGDFMSQQSDTKD